MEKVHTRIWGDAGERVILLHGGNVPDAAITWAEQRPLSDRFQLVIVDRRGFGDIPLWEGAPSFEVGIQDIIDLLGDGGHLIGSSYGGVMAMLTAPRLRRRLRRVAAARLPGDRPPPDQGAHHQPVGAPTLDRCDRLCGHKGGALPEAGPLGRLARAPGGYCNRLCRGDGRDSRGLRGLRARRPAHRQALQRPLAPADRPGLNMKEPAAFPVKVSGLCASTGHSPSAGPGSATGSGPCRPAGPRARSAPGRATSRGAPPWPGRARRAACALSPFARG